MVSTTLANFVGKVSGSTTVNPHLARYASEGANTLLAPSGSWLESLTADYSQFSALDNTIQTSSRTTSGTIAQRLYSFNLIEQIQRQYGITLSGTTADKVAWLKSNLSKLTFNWHGYGSSATGNKASVVTWVPGLSAWFTAGAVSTIVHLSLN